MKKTSRPLLIVGSRPYSLEIADLANETGEYYVAGFVENLERARCAEKLESWPIYWVEELARLAQNHWAVCGIGTTQRERYVVQVSEYGMRFATVVHPRARVSRRSQLGEGTILSVGSIVASYSILGRHVIVNRGALIGHHTHIGDFVTIGPGANVAGFCRIGNNSYIAMGAIVLDRISVGSHSVIGAGAVVTKDVPDHVEVVGIPAAIVKENVEAR